MITAVPGDAVANKKLTAERPPAAMLGVVGAATLGLLLLSTITVPAGATTLRVITPVASDP